MSHLRRWTALWQCSRWALCFKCSLKPVSDINGEVHKDIKYWNFELESLWKTNNISLSLQYIQQNIRSDCANIDKILEPPEGQDEGVWKYEHLRYADLFLKGFLWFLALTSFCSQINCIWQCRNWLNLWLYVLISLCLIHYRQFCLELNGLAVKLQVKILHTRLYSLNVMMEFSCRKRA